MDIKDKLTEVWKEVLITEDISPDDNIMDIGADSYTIHKLCVLSKEKFQISFTSVDLMMYPNINALADLLENGSENSAAAGTGRVSERRRIRRRGEG